jgi:hypothetical protein
VARGTVTLKNQVLDIGAIVFDSGSTVSNRLNLVIDRDDKCCDKFAFVLNGTLQASTYKIKRKLADVVLADVELDASLKIEALTYHFNVYECPAPTPAIGTGGGKGAEFQSKPKGGTRK